MNEDQIQQRLDAVADEMADLVCLAADTAMHTFEWATMEATFKHAIAAARMSARDLRTRLPRTDERLGRLFQ